MLRAGLSIGIGIGGHLVRHAGILCLCNCEAKQQFLDKKENCVTKETRKRTVN